VTQVSGSRDAAGPRWIEVEPGRLPGWAARFGERHGGVPAVELADGVLVLTDPDGARAECHAPPGSPAATATDLASFVAEASAPRRLGLLLARRGGFAVGVADGPTLTASKVDSRYVQGRTAAGGWSQQRFARRRENQARAAADDAAAVAARVLLPAAAGMAALVTGGDRRAVDAVLDDPRLAALRVLRAERFLAVPDPKLTVLQAAVGSARAVLIRLTEG
jgi:hypothetical protein